MPKELLETEAASYSGFTEQRKVNEQVQANIKKYGYGNWYDFCTNEWGCKWDICSQMLLQHDSDGLGFTGAFESPWSPPLGVVKELERQGFEVTLRYHEDLGCYVGIWSAGQDTYYDYKGLRSDEVQKTIGKDLDDHFGISETLFENEEPEEELTAWIKQGVEAREQNF